jgi:branched-chain amino acid aminotransferase
VSLAFHNGRFLPYSELAIPPHDAGFVFGATVTDFCRTYAHKLFRWPDHLARLRRDCDACFVPLPYSDAEITAAAETLVAENAKQLAPNDDLAVITFATPGPLGYMAGTESGPPTVAMHTFPVPKERYRRFFTEGVVLEVVGPAPLNPSLPATIKHRSRIHWWHAAHRRTTPDATATLLSPSLGEDTAVGAVVAIRHGVLECPPPVGVLDSISLRVVKELAVGFGMEVKDRINWPLRPSDDGVTEMLLTGSAFGITGVRAHVVGPDRFDFPWPGPVFTRLAAAWSHLVSIDIVKQFTG